MITRLFSALFAALCCNLLVVAPTHAQQIESQGGFVIPQGGFAGGSAPALDQEGLLMLQAMQQAMTGDYKGAESIYSSILSANPQNADAYLHRGIMRRELKDAQGSQNDAKALVNLSNATLQQNPRDSLAYYHRGMAFRVLKRYDQALKDIETALRLGGDPDWKTDLRDTVLEEKASRGVTQ